MILGTGRDIIEVDRVAKAAAKEGFMSRVSSIIMYWHSARTEEALG